MTNDNIKLTDAEWRVMECLWDRSPQTGRELTKQLEDAAGWSRSTTLTLLTRLESKGAVISGSNGKKKIFTPALRREDAALHETEDFLDRVYKGSLSLLVSSMTKKQALSQDEIKELYSMLKDLEGGAQDA